MASLAVDCKGLTVPNLNAIKFCMPFGIVLSFSYDLIHELLECAPAITQMSLKTAPTV